MDNGYSREPVDLLGIPVINSYLGMILPWIVIAILYAAFYVRLTRNHGYGNAAGIAGDTLSPAGHPGFPQDSDLVERNRFYTNNFNPYDPKSDIKPGSRVLLGTTGTPVSTSDGRTARVPSAARSPCPADSCRRRRRSRTRSRQA